MAHTCRQNQLAPQRNRRAQADLLPGDRPGQGLERRRRERHAQARLAGDQRAHLRVVAMPVFEGFDVLGQTQHALHHGFETRRAPRAGRAVYRQCSVRPT